MHDQCSQLENIENLKINMAKFEIKLDSACETSERIESKLDKHIEHHHNEIKEIKESFNEALAKFSGEMRDQLNLYNANTTAGFKSQAEFNRNNFAGRWLEKVVVKAMWIILTPILGSVGYFLYKVLTSPVMDK